MPGVRSSRRLAQPVIWLDSWIDERTRADEAHLALQHVPELRQLVDARGAQEAAHARDARVVLDLEERAVDLVVRGERLALRLGAVDHRPELR